MCPSDDSISAFAEGRLAGAEREGLAGHLDACAHCRTLVSALAALRGTASLHGPSVAPAEPLGEVPERYRIDRVLGVGGMGTVFAAHDRDLDRPVAIKVVHGPRDAATAERVRLEARALARVRHPNVLSVHDAGVRAGQLFLVMELVTGRTLADVANDPSLDLRTRLRLCLEAARGVVAIHAAGLIHRDLKPANVLWSHDDRVLVADLGLARPEPPSTGAVPGRAVGDAAVSLVGTPAYMAPEQAAGQADRRSDQYSFAVMALEVLGGAAPAAIVRVLQRGRATDPARRHADMATLLAALVVASRRSRPRRIAAMAVAVAAVAGAGAVVVVAASQEAPARPAATAAADASVAAAVTPPTPTATAPAPAPLDAGSATAAPADAGEVAVVAAGPRRPPRAHPDDPPTPTPTRAPETEAARLLDEVPAALRGDFDLVRWFGDDGKPHTTIKPRSHRASAWWTAHTHLHTALQLERDGSCGKATTWFKLAAQAAERLAADEPSLAEPLRAETRAGVARCQP